MIIVSWVSLKIKFLPLTGGSCTSTNGVYLFSTKRVKLTDTIYSFMQDTVLPVLVQHTFVSRQPECALFSNLDGLNAVLEGGAQSSFARRRRH